MLSSITLLLKKLNGGCRIPVYAPAAERGERDEGKGILEDRGVERRRGSRAKR